MTVEAPADPMCVCGDPKSAHRLGRKGCKAIDCGCAAFEAADDAAEKTRVLEVVASVCEDQADRARTELGQQSTSAQLRAVEAERDRLLAIIRTKDGDIERLQAERDANMRAQSEAAGKLIAQRNGAAERWGNARIQVENLNERVAELEQLLADAALKLVQQGNEYSAELVRLRVLLEQAEQATAPLRIDPVELYGYDAWQCDGCGSRYRPFDATHPCGPLKPVRVSVTRRQEHHQL